MNTLDKFGQFIVANMFDKSIEQHLMLQRGVLKGKAMQELQKKVNALNMEQKQVMLEAVMDALETAMHDFLFAIHESQNVKGGVEIVVDGVYIAEESDLLNGEPLGEDGWIARFSKFRNVL